MLATFRAAVADFVAASGIVPVWDVIPDDAAEVPCVVIGRPVARQTSVAVVFDLALEVLLIGNRQQAGGTEQEMVETADLLWLLFNGTRAANNQGFTLAVRSLFPREQMIAGLNYPAYTMTVESSIATC